MLKNPAHSAFLACALLLQFLRKKFAKLHHTFTELKMKSSGSRSDARLLILGNSELKKLILGPKALTVFGRDLGGGG
jgi:hypothetical protein